MPTRSVAGGSLLHLQDLMLPPPSAFALQLQPTLPDPPAVKSDLLLASLQQAGIPVLARPDPELEDLIDDELGLPPVIDDLTAGIQPTSRDGAEIRDDASSAGTVITTAKHCYQNASPSRRMKVPRCHDSRHLSASCAHRRVVRPSEYDYDVEPYSLRNPQFKRNDYYRHRRLQFPVTHRHQH